MAYIYLNRCRPCAAQSNTTTWGHDKCNTEEKKNFFIYVTAHNTRKVLEMEQQWTTRYWTHIEVTLQFVQSTTTQGHEKWNAEEKYSSMFQLLTPQEVMEMELFIGWVYIIGLYMLYTFIQFIQSITIPGYENWNVELKYFSTFQPPNASEGVEN